MLATGIQQVRPARVHMIHDRTFSPRIMSKLHAEGKTMIKKIVAGCVILILAVITYWVGRFVGAESASKSRTKRDVTVHTELVKLDEMFLTNVVTRTSTLASGFYRLETKLAGKPTITSRM